MTFFVRLLSLVALLAAAGCATTGDADPRDPWEPANRAIYRFNEGFDDAIARPVATAYRDTLPEEVRGRVRNFFANIADIFIGVNNMLQGKFEDGVTDWARFAFNSTFGGTLQRPPVAYIPSNAARTASTGTWIRRIG